ncbi:uncharacterized protein LOC109596213 isoform X2 [Aethina tumida]|uniref:uncharacterized protein LOC109596213 isoform X2 n=1 Tax=Aethina tumida TaxID=116153 RepID=UPI002147FCC7|nr:uncharacterized protein LOC109596213 isoform X2 [Aethina tumida]
MASVGFRWLDILEKEFDKAFVDLDLSIGELESEEPDVVFNVRQKLCTLSSCFAQLTHKSQTIFQNSAKIEAELIHMRTELVESKAKREVLERELHNLLLQLHSQQLSYLPDSKSSGKKQDMHIIPDINNIKKKLEAEIKQSPVHLNSEELKLNPTSLENASYKAENAQLHLENTALRNSILALSSEVYGAKLAAKYLDKELAGRIQQLQLLGREMRGDIRDKLWRQLESEILLQRHKTVVRACRRNSMINGNSKICPKPETEGLAEGAEQHFGDIRTVVVKRKPGQGLGISITGGREHGVPILISELEPNGPAALCQQLYIGDAILYVNDRDLRQACHREAVGILQQQTGDCVLQVQYIAADDSDNSLEEDGYNFRFFDDEVGDVDNSLANPRDNPEEILNTPTAPRTPESTTASRVQSRSSIQSASEIKNAQNLLDINTPETETCKDIYNYNLNCTNDNLTDIFKKQIIKDDKISDVLNCDNLCLNRNSITDQLTTLSNQNIATDETNTVNDLILIDNAKNNVIKLENFKKVQVLCNDDNFNCSTNSLNSENLSSPMQTSADVYLDSEVLSTDIASNDSQSPKNQQSQPKPEDFSSFKTSSDSLGNLKSNNDVFFGNMSFIDKHSPVAKDRNSEAYGSNDSLSNPKSDQSLLNSGESCGSSPVRKTNRDYRKQRKHKKKYFGVKTLQSIFNKHDGYSDISTTASEFGDEPEQLKPRQNQKIVEIEEKKAEQPEPAKSVVKEISSVKWNNSSETTQQFEENIHTFLSDIFQRNFTASTAPEPANVVNLSVNRPTGTKKYFSLHGQHLRVGKALRLCPNEDYKDIAENEQRKEKLLARYVYNANCFNADGVGDPDFGTPV